VKSKSKQLILEADVSIGNQSQEEVRRRLQALYDDDRYDIQVVGHCGDAMACLTAYILSEKAATQLLEESTPLCGKTTEPVDFLIQHACESGLLNCCYVEYPNMPGLFGEGLVQQNRSHVKGMHNMANGHNYGTLATVDDNPLDSDSNRIYTDYHQLRGSRAAKQ
jgi:hypothetical protein